MTREAGVGHGAALRGRRAVPMGMRALRPEQVYEPQQLSVQLPGCADGGLRPPVGLHLLGTSDQFALSRRCFGQGKEVSADTWLMGATRASWTGAALGSAGHSTFSGSSKEQGMFPLA